VYTRPQRISLECEKTTDGKINTSIALGCATKSAASEDIGQVLQKAEAMMYQEKLLASSRHKSSVLKSIQQALHEKSESTEEHSQNVQVLCQKMAAALQLSEAETADLELLAYLHDIGKIAVSDLILNKPGSLTAEEWREMKRHPEIGYRITQSVPELAQVAEYILAHHERWDGTGYPKGISGPKIPRLSRILAVADSYDAMTSERSYRDAIPQSEAVLELQRNAGTQFDPELVQLFLEKVLFE
jgi:HD-GYP domain-containing protein (c-di-GMP phosphodiesterase class II)